MRAFPLDKKDKCFVMIPIVMYLTKFKFRSDIQ